MIQIIDFNNFTKSVKQDRNEKTQLYRDILIAQGMEEISKSDLLGMLKDLNYSIDNSMCHKYYNTGNEYHYNAISMSYKDNKTKQSYAHFEQSFTNAENLAKLQKIRNKYFVFENNTILDL